MPSLGDGSAAEAIGGRAEARLGVLAVPDLDLARDPGRHLFAEIGAEPAEAHALRFGERGGREIAERE